MTIAAEGYVSCGDEQKAEWWSDRCNGCEHMLAIHRTVVEGAMICDMCALAAEVISGVKQFARGLRDDTKTYIDSENERFATVAKNYIDNKGADIVQYVEAQDATVVQFAKDEDTAAKAVAKNYVDSKDTAVRTEMPVWVNNRFVAVVKAEALKMDPRV